MKIILTSMVLAWLVTPAMLPPMGDELCKAGPPPPINQHMADEFKSHQAEWRDLIEWIVTIQQQQVAKCGFKTK